MTYVFLEDGEIAIHDDRWFTMPWGVNGGQPGARARKVLRRVDGTTEVVGNKREDLHVKAGDELDFITWGGGGWGDPLERDPALVAKEVGQGLVTAKGARAYGVVIAADAMVDPAATETLRGSLRRDRPDTLPTFDYGPSIDALRERSREDTGLDAPRQPVWGTSRAADAETLALAAE